MKTKFKRITKKKNKYMILTRIFFSTYKRENLYILLFLFLKIDFFFYFNSPTKQNEAF